MNEMTTVIGGKSYRTVTLNTVVVGSGAAGFNAALRLHSLGVTDCAIVTEGVKMGTSRNTGSDKQTYYKMNLCADYPDSPRSMAEARNAPARHEQEAAQSCTFTQSQSDDVII